MKQLLYLFLLLLLSNWSFSQKFEDYKAFASGQGNITSVVYHPNGKSFACGNSHGIILIRDMETNDFLNILKGHSKGISHLNYHPNGTHLVSTSHDGTVQVWDLKTDKVIFSSNIKEQTPEKPIGDGYTFAFFSVDGQAMIYGGSDGKLMITRPFLPNSHKGVISSYNYGLTCADYSSNGNFVVVGSKDNLKIVDFLSKKVIRVLQNCNGWVYDVKYNADGSQIGSLCDDGTFTLWNSTSGERIKSWNVTEKGETTQIAFSPDGKYLVTGDTNKSNPILKVWDLNTQEIMSELKGHQSSIRSVNFSPDSKFIASGGNDKQVKIWQWKQVFENEELPIAEEAPLPPPNTKERPPRFTYEQSTAIDEPEVVLPSKPRPKPQPQLVEVAEEIPIPEPTPIEKPTTTPKPKPTTKPIVLTATKPADRPAPKAKPSPKPSAEVKTLPEAPPKPSIANIEQSNNLPKSLEGVDMVLNSRNLPDSLGNRKVKMGKNATVKNTSIDIIVWDKEFEDGDIISLYYNGEWLLKEYTLTSDKRKLHIDVLPSEDNFMILYAHNEGERPPNTAAVAILDGERERQLVLSSDLYRSDMINFKYAGE